MLEYVSTKSMKAKAKQTKVESNGRLKIIGLTNAHDNSRSK
jgi:hypothetical protein